MAFDIGIDFRASTGFVTDPAGYTYCTFDNYPTTRNGVTFGWVTAIGGNVRDRTSSQDPRLAGIAFQGNGASKALFRVDLPASGSVDISAAVGDAGGANFAYLEVFDNSTSLGVLVPVNTPSVNSFYDAAGVLYTAANWPANNTSVNKTFGTTTCIFAITPGNSAGGNFVIASLRLVQAAAGGTTYNKSVSGSITAAGAITKQAGKAVSGSITATGALVKRTSKGFAGSCTGSGGLVKQTAKSYTGSATPAGSLNKQTTKSFSGSITGTGVTTTMILFTAAIDGAITVSGALSRMTLKGLTGSSTLSGAVSKMTAKGLSASITLDGALNRLTKKAFAGSVTAAGNLFESYQVLKSLAGSIKPTGAVTALYIVFVAGVLKLLTMMGVGQ